MRDNNDTPIADTPPTPDAYTGFLLNMAERWVKGQVDAALAPLGLRARYIGVLSLLAHGPLAQIALAERLHVDRTTMVSMMDELEGAGLVARVRNPHDRRAYAATLTDTGRTTLRDAHARILVAEANALAALAPDERDTLRVLLTRVVSPGE